MERSKIVCRHPNFRHIGFRFDLRETLGVDPLFRSIGLVSVYSTRQPRAERSPAGEPAWVSDPFVVCIPVGSVPLFELDSLGGSFRADLSQEVALGESL